MINVAVVYVATYPNRIRISRTGTPRLHWAIVTFYSTEKIKYIANIEWQVVCPFLHPNLNVLSRYGIKSSSNIISNIFNATVTSVIIDLRLFTLLVSPNLFFTNGIIIVFIKSDVEARAYVLTASYAPDIKPGNFIRVTLFAHLITSPRGITQSIVK